MAFSRFSIIATIMSTFIFCCFFAKKAAANDVAESGFNYNLNLDLSYIDLLRRPNTSGGSLPGVISVPQESSQFADQPTISALTPQRTLGLKQLRMDLSWVEMDRTILEVTLRPDAELKRYQDSNEVAKEYDTRSGQVYKQTSAIHLLDSYRLSILQGNSLVFTFGVLDELTPYYTSYPTPLTFGLMTMLPQKCSAIKILLKERDVAEPTAQPKTPSTLVGSISIFEGDRDRGELITYQDRTYDRATSDQDPYRGIAVSTAVIPDSSNEYGVFAGFHDTRTTNGKENETFYQVFASTIIRTQNKPLKISLDTRYSRTSWDNTDTRVRTLEQLSASLTGSYKLLTNQWLALGGHVGKSDQHISTDRAKSEQYRGWQIDLGVIKALSNTTNVSLFVNQENRKNYSGNTTKGGFKNKSKTISSLKRVALELSYAI